MDARRAAEQVARQSYGRLVAYLAAQFRDVTAAEDALGDAFLAALNSWGEKGIPHNPEAWLLVTARRRLLDTTRRSHSQERLLSVLKSAVTENFWPNEGESEEPFPDERLKLLFICAHPAIDAGIHTPLMLQTVLGLTAQQIASAFLVAPATMGQRLVRAKAKIRDAGIAFAVPPESQLPTRLGAVLQAIYAAYTHGWESVIGGDPRHQGLAEEAIWLARLCVQLLPAEPEARGLLALMLHCKARLQARRTPQGAYVPLLEQDTGLWSRPLIQEAECQLALAAQAQTVGRFQLEAAIQSIHAQRAVTGLVDWPALALMYEGLIRVAPTLGARVGHAAAMAEAHGWELGLQLLDPLPLTIIQNYQPYWALKAYLFKKLGQGSAAQHAYTRAIGLSEDPAIREFLLEQSRLG